MKKHIKKKFLHEVTFTAAEMKEIENNTGVIPWEKSYNLKKVSNDTACLLILDNNKVITAFPYKYQGSMHWIPEPDPVLIYFNTAYYNFKQIEDKKKQILRTLANRELNEEIINDLYIYYGLTSGFVISLFTALEAFINRIIPRNYTYKRKNGIEVFSKEEIVRCIAFDEKLKKVLIEAKEKSFKKDYPMKYQRIINLKEFRDSIVHTKASDEGHTPYDHLYKKALNFDYINTINAVKDFCNFYAEINYIEECPCNNND